MGYAAQAMKKVHENMDLDKIDSLMDDITEQQAVAQEISEAISNRVGFGDEFDEDELMAELEELEQEELNKKMTDVRLPSVPSTSLPSRPAKSSRFTSSGQPGSEYLKASGTASISCSEHMDPMGLHVGTEIIHPEHLAGSRSQIVDCCRSPIDSAYASCSSGVPESTGERSVVD
ncbi:Charged multivesicular body protein 4c [Chelonia mydas]|uniref:Charged multivesicular body protein 4c n=1 Tax=Chelonia mydas TaxID=8469 RepID=M7BYK2_CHEMY|nr:Charged multivesicular body protein 4c [Chelonia mydas]